jgi:hypothetical protein
MQSNTRTLSLGLFGLILGVTFVSAVAGQAPAPPAPIPTVWDKLGITGGLSKLRNATVNRNGNRPELEKKPPLKTIADPANLDPKMPKAVQAAAAIKQQEDLAPQKIKAIKYLATMGCGCYQKTVDVRGALLEALDDCTEEVRYEAATALCQVAGDPCSQCGGTCCNAETMNKLQEHASGKDANGCFKETSERVRNMAQGALDACRRKLPPGPAEVAPIPQVPGGEKPVPVQQPGGERPSGVRGGPTPVQPRPQIAPPQTPLPTPPTNLNPPTEVPVEPVKPTISQWVPRPTYVPILDVQPVRYELARPVQQGQAPCRQATATVNRVSVDDPNGPKVVIRFVESQR